MDHKTKCVILRRIPYREKSLIVHTFTKDCGRIDLMLKGGRNISSTHFPSAELFRLFTLEFTQRDSGIRASASDLYNPKVMEYAGNFDAVALHTENYLMMCEYASFLLKHTASFLALPETFDSLLLLLDRMARGTAGAFDVSAAKLVFLNESGLLPENTGEADRNALLREILAYALRKDTAKPSFSPGYEKKLTEWVKALCCYHGLV